MIIQTLNRDYYMIQRLSHSDEADIYLCKDNNKQDTQLIFRLIRLKNPEIVNAAIAIFMDQKDNKANQNFVECFPKDGEFYIVFINCNEDSIEKKLKKEICSFAERLEIGKNIIEKMILLNIPNFMQYEALDFNNLSVAASLEIGFNYTLDSLTATNDIATTEVISAYGRVCRLLFSEELKMEVSEELSELVSRLDKGDFNNYVIVYQAYNEIYLKLNELVKSGQVKPRGVWFRKWEKIKKIAIRMKPAVFTLIILVIVGYIIYLLMRPSVLNQSQTVFKSIGTVEIEEMIESKPE